MIDLKNRVRGGKFTGLLCKRIDLNQISSIIIQQISFSDYGRLPFYVGLFIFLTFYSWVLITNIDPHRGPIYSKG